MKLNGDEYEHNINPILQSFVSVVWYTAMVGKKSSLKAVLKLLRAEGIKNVRTTRFDPVRTSLLQNRSALTLLFLITHTRLSLITAT